MIAAIIPQFFSSDLKRTLDYYESHLGFETQFEYGEPPHYAGVVRDGLSIYFRHTDQVPLAPPDKYEHELLDAYFRVDDVGALVQEFARNGVVFWRELGPMPWGLTEFVVRDSDGRLLCFGQETELVGAQGA